MIDCWILQLASGFDKSRNDSSVMVWDLAHTGISSSTVSTSSGTYFDLNKPLYEFGNGELVHSLKWYQNNCVICGMNNKAIKIFDLRDLNKPKSGSFTKAVNGIVLDPHFDYRLASFTEVCFLFFFKFLTLVTFRTLSMFGIQGDSIIRSLRLAPRSRISSNWSGVPLGQTF